MPKVQIERLTVGEIDENCYLVVNPETGELLVIDPGRRRSGFLPPSAAGSPGRCC